MNLREEYIEWREGIENVYQMHGAEMAIKYIYQPDLQISQQVQNIVEATIHLRTDNTTRAFELIKPLLPTLDTLQEDQRKDAFIILGHYYLDINATDQLKEIIDSALNAFPNEVRFYILQAKLKVLSENISLYESLESLLNKFGNSTEVLIELGNSLFQDYQNQEAKPYIEKALSIDSNNIQALNLMGYIELEAKNDQAAYNYFIKSVEIWPFQLNTFYSLIDVALIMKDWEGTRKVFEYALNYFPSDSKLLLEFASLLVSTKVLSPKEVEIHLRSTTERLPNNARAHQYLAYFLANTNNFEEALQEIERSIEIDSSDSALKLKERIETNMNSTD